jgi:hypothetical protein
MPSGPPSVTTAAACQRLGRDRRGFVGIVARSYGSLPCVDRGDRNDLPSPCRFAHVCPGSTP